MVSGLVQRRRDPETSTNTNTNTKKEKSAARDALKFFFNDDGVVFREFVLGNETLEYINTNSNTNTKY